MTEDIPFWVALSHIRGIGPVRFKKLLKTFGNAASVWCASLDDLRGTLGERLAEEIAVARKKIVPEKLYESVLRENIRVVPFSDPRYPPLLQNIEYPPFLLYVEGDFDFQAYDRYLAIVGTRHPTPYGVKAARFFAQGLAREGWVIVSGLAVGIDGEAQKTVAEEGYPTVAVLGSGLRRIYPKVHIPLAREIVERGGVLVSEYPPFTEPRPEHFPLRNRIIAGLSLGVLVVEAPRKSGALITADFALEAGREVMAVPGPIFSPQSEGTNALIAQGAKPVQSIADVLEVFGYFSSQNQKILKEEHVALSSKEQKLFSLIDYAGVFKEELLAQTGWDEGELFEVLLALELKGLVEELPGGRVGRK